jgi:hypothetical protein
MHGFPVFLPSNAVERNSSITSANTTATAPPCKRSRLFPASNSDFCVIFMNTLCRIDEIVDKPEIENSPRTRSHSQSRTTGGLFQRSTTLTDRFSLS